MLATYTVPECNLSSLLFQLSKLSVKARKCGAEPIIFEETGETFKQVPVCHREDHSFCLHNLGETKTVRFVTVQVSGASPKIAGWNFLATVTHEEAGNTIRQVPGTEELTVPASYRTSMAGCVHCGQKRNRKDTYLVWHQTDNGPLSILEVGGDCLKDFLGHKDPHALAAFLEGLYALEAQFGGSEDDDYEDICGRSIDYTHTLTFLAHVSAEIGAHGWVSRHNAEEWGKPSTSGCALENIYLTEHPATRRDGTKVKPIAIQDQDVELAKKVVEWGRTTLLAKQTKSDYEHNLAVTLAKDELVHRDLGIVASAVVAYRKAMSLLEERKPAADKKESQWVSEVGKREVFNLRVLQTFERPGNFGPTTIINFEDPDGNKLVWFASGVWEFERGEVCTLKGTVKRHAENVRFGYKETVLTRCKIESTTVPGPATVVVDDRSNYEPTMEQPGYDQPLHHELVAAGSYGTRANGTWGRLS